MALSLFLVRLAFAYGSCLEAQNGGETVDKEYNLNLKGASIEIYCHGMNSTTPRAYINLQATSE